MVSDLNIFLWKLSKIAAQRKVIFVADFALQNMVETLLPANFGIFLDVFEFLRFGWVFPFFKKIGFRGILGPPSYGIGATIRIGREMLCLPYAGFFANKAKQVFHPFIQFSSQVELYSHLQLNFQRDSITLGVPKST